MTETVRTLLITGRIDPPRVGAVVVTGQHDIPYALADHSGASIDAVADWVRDLVLGDVSTRTARAYCYALLTWFRVLWALNVPWTLATENDVAVLVGWLRAARNPQRVRRHPESAPAGSVNMRTGKRVLPAGYSASTINLTLAATRGFYEYHAHFGVGPVVNPVPESHRQAVANRHRSPDDPQVIVRRSRLRQKASKKSPRSIPDGQWDELFDAMGCDRDKALLACYVSSGARATELLGLRESCVDWAGQRIRILSKGGEMRTAPLSPEAMLLLTRYAAQRGPIGPEDIVWRARRGTDRPLTYAAMRRVLQRAGTTLGTNWTLHDLRHTAAVRMAGDPALTLTDVQTILGHRDIRTTTQYTVPRVEEMFDRLQSFYSRPRVTSSLPAGYDPRDVKAVFGD
ncbi:site-specific integrase [Streptomyces sp. NPDC088183]|uniref:tyrosine-type recombinase/integrase n=1 Tax=Streptomyces sp. NPDC088183 TaxID=3160992 RepID=UPI00343C366D